MFSLVDLLSAASLMRFSIFLLMLLCWNELRIIANEIRIKAIKAIVYKIGYGVLIFAVLRLIANFLDIWLKQEFSDVWFFQQVGWFTYFSNVGFWVWILHYLRKTRIRVQSPEVGDEGRGKLSEYARGILIQMKLEQENLKSQTI